MFLLWKTAFCIFGTFSFLLPPKAEAKRGMQRRRNNRKCKRGSTCLGYLNSLYASRNGCEAVARKFYTEVHNIRPLRA